MLTTANIQAIRKALDELELPQDHFRNGHVAAEIAFPVNDALFDEDSLRANSSEDIKSYATNLSKSAARILGTRSGRFREGFIANMVQRWHAAKSQLPEEREAQRVQSLKWRAESRLKSANKTLVAHESCMVDDPYHAMDWSDGTMQAVAERKVAKIVLELLRQLADEEDQHITHVCEVEERIVRQTIQAGFNAYSSSSMSRTSLRMEEVQAWSNFAGLAFDQFVDG